MPFLIWYQNKIFPNYPIITVHSDWSLKDLQCPKCQIGKIKYSKLCEEKGLDHSETLFICFNCNTVYPEIYIRIFLESNA
jgi:hypothetical protein